MLTLTFCFQTSRYGILPCLHWILISNRKCVIDRKLKSVLMRRAFCLSVASSVCLTNRMWFSVVYSFIDNGTRHHSGQNGVDSRGAAKWVRNKFWPLWWRVSLSIKLYTTLNHIRFVFYHNIKETESLSLKMHAPHYANDCLYASDFLKNFCKLA